MNAALEWQAGSLGRRSKEVLGACPLKELVRKVFLRYIKLVVFYFNSLSAFSKQFIQS
jgi:hypothetical protein